MERKTALQILNAIEKNGAFSNLAVNEGIKRAEGADAAFVRRLVYGVLENRIYLDYYISGFLKDPIEKVKKNSLNILRLALYQILYMDSVPDYAAVNEAVQLAKETGKAQAPFVNGVLRNVLRSKERGIKLPDKNKNLIKHLSVKYSCPQWMIRYISEGFGASFAESFLEAANQVPPLTVRVNRLKTDREELSKKLEELGFGVRASEKSPQALEITGNGIFDTELFRQGYFHAQDVSSMLAVEALNPQPGETILDLCAAPGGKTIYAAELMNNTGRVIAGDIYESKLGLIRKAAEAGGASIVETVKNDATVYNKDFEGLADRVICDVPCSGLGVIRRKPEIKYTKSMQDIKSMCRIQFAVLRNAAKYVKPGGTLVYSTCTVSRLENHGVIEHFLKKPENSGFVKEEERQLTPFEDGTDGFYYCKLKFL